MKIVIDENIPFIQGVFEPWAEMTYSPGQVIVPTSARQPASLPQPPGHVIDLTHYRRKADPLDIVASAVIHINPSEEDDLLLRTNPEKFEYLRDNYRIRGEFNSFSVRTIDPKAEKILSDPGFQIIK